MIVFLLLLHAIPSDGVNLRWQFKQGDTFQQETISKLTQVVKARQQEFKQDIVQTSLIKYTVSAVEPNGNVLLDQQIESMKATNPDGSPSKGNNAVFNQLQGAILKAKLTPELKVEQLEGYDELLKRLAGDDPNVRRVVTAILSEEQLKNAISYSMGFVPQKAMPAGSTWKKEMTLTMGPLGTVQISQAFKFEGMETIEGTSLAKITYQPTVNYVPPKADAINPELSITKGKIELKSASGVIYFDPAGGRLHHSELKLTLGGEMTAQVQGSEIPVTFEQTQSIAVRMKK